jgi:zinc protease
MIRGTLVRAIGIAVALMVTAAQERQPQALPTVDQLFDKFLEAIGGRAARDRITSRIVVASVDRDGVEAGGFEEYWKAPDHYAVVAETVTGRLRMGLSGNTGWTQPAGSAAQPMSEDQLVNTRMGMFKDDRMRSVYKTMSVRGRETVNGFETYVVDTVTTAGEVGALYFDARGGLLIRQDRARTYGGELVHFSNYFENYREVDGLKLCFRIRNVFPDGTRTVTIKEVKQNVPIDEAVFRPKI